MGCTGPVKTGAWSWARHKLQLPVRAPFCPSAAIPQSCAYLQRHVGKHVEADGRLVLLDEGHVPVEVGDLERVVRSGRPGGCRHTRAQPVSQACSGSVHDGKRGPAAGQARDECRGGRLTRGLLFGQAAEGEPSGAHVLLEGVQEVELDLEQIGIPAARCLRRPMGGRWGAKGHARALPLHAGAITTRPRAGQA